MNQDRLNQLIANLTIAVLAIMLVGGSIVGWLLNKELPEWLKNADIAIIVAAFGSGAFFGLARTAGPTAALAQQIQDDHHELAMNVASMMPTLTSSGDTSDHERRENDTGVK